MKKASNEEIITAYKETGSIWKTAQRLGMCGQSVHERLRALHYKMQCPRWSTEEIEQLRSMVGISQIVKQQHEKVYSDTPGAWIIIRECR